MAIKVAIGDLRVPPAEWEDCVICQVPTPLWSTKKDVPICAGCSSSRHENDVPSKREWLSETADSELRN